MSFSQKGSLDDIGMLGPRKYPSLPNQSSAPGGGR